MGGQQPESQPSYADVLKAGIEASVLAGTITAEDAAKMLYKWLHPECGLESPDDIARPGEW